MLDPTRRFDGLAADNEWTWRAVGLVCHVVNFGATLSDAGQEDLAPHGVESVGDVNFNQHSGTTRLPADFDEASCGMYSCLAAQGRAYAELDGAQFGAESGCSAPSPVQGAAAAAALAAKWAELNRRDAAIPLNTICGRNMRQILRVCDITLPRHQHSTL